MRCKIFNLFEGEILFRVGEAFHVQLDNGIEVKVDAADVDFFAYMPTIELVEVVEYVAA
ncbi:hypothetical protein KEU06_09450 [Pseudaminobacter sp. 19-2017]|uniref:Uncharacterized protein n=1 Tax=Pseudaminobacter soli (ex Zhang et al. 2022) TaxID=2831468 RepID=A0A942I7Y2_9HYPH|nr:hypothetical protein [Pseudaminobacter soli]MBS3648830.1 hypothetical protein [Pseudaminobacter soli]